jgi:hypothetical protein
VEARLRNCILFTLNISENKEPQSIVLLCVTSEICFLFRGMNIISCVQKQIFGLTNDEVEWFRMLCTKNVHNLHKVQSIIGIVECHRF